MRERHIIRLKTLVLLFFSVLIVSCTTTGKTTSALTNVYITDTAAIHLLHPSATGTAVDMYQKIAGSYANKEFSFDAIVIMNNDELNVMLFNSFGTTIGKLFYDGTAASIDSPFFPKSLKPEYIIADFQLCCYQLEQIKQSIESAGLRFESDYSAGTETRIIRDKDGTILIHIQKTPQKITYRNLHRNYSYTIYGEFDAAQ